MGLGCGISTSLLMKNLIFYRPNKKATINSVLQIVKSIFSAIFIIVGQYTFGNFDDDELNIISIMKAAYVYLVIGTGHFCLDFYYSIYLILNIKGNILIE